VAKKELRKHQSRAIYELRKAVADGYKRILLVAPTGSGKSVMFSKIIESATNKGNPVLFLVHKRELIFQASKHMDNEGVYHGVIMSGVVPTPMANVQLASIMTIHRRKKKTMFTLPRAKVVIVDEAHRTGSNTYNELLDEYDDESKVLIGFTATPVRKNGRGLGKQFEKMIVVTSVSELQELGFLCETEYMVPSIPDLSSIDVRDGDYVEEQLQELMDDKTLVGNIVDHYVRYASGRKAVVFASGIQHSIHLKDRFLVAGYRAAHIDANTPQKERDEIHDKFERNELDIICNVNIYTEGVDMPDVSCVIIARPSRSLVFHLQSIGRGLRPKPDGGNCLIIDHAGNCLRMGWAETDFDWSLDEFETIYERSAANDDKPKEQNDTKYICSNCGTIFDHSPRCPKCGEPIERHGKKLEAAKGELTLFRPKKEKKEKGPERNKQEWYSMFTFVANKKGYQRGWIAHKYREVFGVWPKDLSHHALPPTADFNNYMKHLAIKNRKRREKENG